MTHFTALNGLFYKLNPMQNKMDLMHFWKQTLGYCV